MTPHHIQLHGVLGAALEANLRGRLSHFITAPDSPAIVLFSPEHRARNTEGDWYGEHAGKWLSAAARAYDRSGDPATGQRRSAGQERQQGQGQGQEQNHQPALSDCRGLVAGQWAS